VAAGRLQALVLSISFWGISFFGAFLFLGRWSVIVVTLNYWILFVGLDAGSFEDGGLSAVVFCVFLDFEAVCWLSGSLSQARG